MLGILRVVLYALAAITPLLAVLTAVELASTAASLPQMASMLQLLGGMQVLGGWITSSLLGALTWVGIFATRFLLETRARPKRRKLRLSWAGGLRQFRDQYTALDLQKKALEWRGE